MMVGIVIGITDRAMIDCVCAKQVKCVETSRVIVRVRFSLF